MEEKYIVFAKHAEIATKYILGELDLAGKDWIPDLSSRI
jgi:hypothetical protein